ncbi:MAG: MATE family efflux transporter [Bacteroidetes bacterium]|nr:MATE family efflux transporter [Bacteroidota bacterium]
MNNSSTRAERKAAKASKVSVQAIDSKTFLGTEPIWPLLRRLSVPAIIGMLVNALYNFVDTIYVGQGVGPLAIGALSITFPIQMLISAFAMMFGVGSASIISRRLGEKNEEAAANAAGTALSATVIVALVITVLGTIFIEPLLAAFGATENILPYSRDYLSIIFLGSVFISISMSSNNIIRAEGKAKAAMFIMVIGTGANLVLDPIFIFGFNMGIKGAAVATIISQVLSAMYAIRFFINNESILPLHLSSFKIRFKVLWETVILGFSFFVRQAGGSLLALTANNMLKIYGGDMGITAYGMVLRVMIFFLMPIFGLVHGFQPIAGYNYGAKRMDRVKEVIWKSILVCSIMGLFGFIMIMFFPRLILTVFTSDVEALAIAVPALRTVMLMVPLLGIQAISSTFFQSAGKAIPSFFLGLSRQYIFLIPLILILPGFLGLSGVWVAFPIADLMATLISTTWMLIELKRMSRKFNDTRLMNEEGAGNRC